MPRLTDGVRGSRPQFHVSLEPFLCTRAAGLQSWLRSNWGVIAAPSIPCSAAEGRGGALCRAGDAESPDLRKIIFADAVRGGSISAVNEGCCSCAKTVVSLLFEQNNPWSGMECCLSWKCGFTAFHRDSM